MAVVRRSIGKRLTEKADEALIKTGIQKENPEIRGLLSGLYPGESVKRKYREYRMKKMMLVLGILISGICAFICVQISSRTRDRLKEGTRLSRNEWGEGSYFITLQAQTLSGEGKISYQVNERSFSKEELKVMLSEVKEKLPDLIVSENENLAEVNRDLNLVTAVEGYPFSLTWKTADYEKIRTDGKVDVQEVPKEGEEVLLTAVYSYEDYRWEQEIVVKLVPVSLSSKEQFLLGVKELLAENDADFREETEIILPDSLNGELISWEEKKENSGIFILFLGAAATVLAAYGMDRDLRKKNETRKREISNSYPEFVSRLKLYMGAGLTIRNAFLRIGKDYRKEKQETGKTEYLYEELLLAGYQLSNGKSEDRVYREWGRRCEVLCCRKLAFLLASSLRQGNEKILLLLSKEACLAWEERKNRARKLGEEAGTKMLFPMLLMLLVVMFLILLPAFIDLGTG